MSEPIFVIPTSIHDGQAPSGVKFKSFTDQNKKTWFVSDEKIMLMLQANKGYNIISFNESEKGNVITGLELAADRLPQPQATRPIRQPIVKPMDRIEASRMCMMAISYAKDLCINSIIRHDEMFSEADKIIKWANEQTDKLMKG